MDIKVIGEGCDKCDKLYANTQTAIAALGIQPTLTKVENLLDIVRLGVMTSPSILVDGKLIVSGQVATADKIEKLLKALL